MEFRASAGNPRADFRHGDRVIPFPTSDNADQFLEFVAKELIPWTEKTCSMPHRRHVEAAGADDGVE